VILAPVCRLELPNDSLSSLSAAGRIDKCKETLYGQVQGNVVMIWLIQSPMSDYISHDTNTTASTRGFLQCMRGRHGSAVDGQRRRAASQHLLESPGKERVAAATNLSFLQISAAYRFSKEANKMSRRHSKSRWTGSTPCDATAFLIHTGDLTSSRKRRSSTRSMRC